MLNEETKHKIRLANKGKHFSPNTEFTSERLKQLWQNPKHKQEVSKKISLAMIGNKNGIGNKGNKGKHLSKEHRQKIRTSMIGKPHPHKHNGQGFKKGHQTWNKNHKYSIKTIEKIKLARANQIFPLKDSKIEIKIQNFLKQLGINFFTHQYIKEIKHAYQCDILIPEWHMVIECDGDYWHHYPVGNEIDRVRSLELCERGYKVLRLWENEIKKMDIEQFKEKLKYI